MKIAIEAAHANKENRTGVENVCFFLIEELKKQIAVTDEVILYSNKPLQGKLSQLPANWSVKVLKWSFKKGWSQIRLSLALLKDKPDVFLALGQLVPLYCPKNTITVVHDSAFRIFPQFYGFLSRKYLHWMNKKIAKKSKLVITPSQFSKKEFCKLYNYPLRQVKVVPWGYDQDSFKILEDNQLKIKKHGLHFPYLIYLGRIENKKNVAKLVRAFNIIKKDKPELQLALVGTAGVGYEDIKKEIKASEYSQDIIETGWVNDSEIPILLNKATMMVLPSNYEGFGLPVLEAMACGCPVVCSYNSSLPEVGGEAVEYVDSHDEVLIAKGINKVLNKEEYRFELIKKGLKEVEKYNWTTTAHFILNLFQDDMGRV